MKSYGPYGYKWLDRETVDGKRMYVGADGGRLPSVTTVLSCTLPEAKREGLDKWAAEVGPREAARIRDEAGVVGSNLHATVESLLTGENRSTGRTCPLARQGMLMGVEVHRFVAPLIETLWGVEVPLHFPGRYAGVTDVVGIIEGEPAIMDFKQSNRDKRDGYCADYYMQATMYARAHDELHGTRIRNAHVVVCTRAGQVQRFHLTGDAFDGYAALAQERVDLYHAGHRSSTSF